MTSIAVSVSELTTPNPEEEEEEGRKSRKIDRGDRELETEEEE